MQDVRTFRARILEWAPTGRGAVSASCRLRPAGCRTRFTPARLPAPAANRRTSRPGTRNPQLVIICLAFDVIFSLARHRLHDAARPFCRRLCRLHVPPAGQRSIRARLFDQLAWVHRSVAAAEHVIGGKAAAADGRAASVHGHGWPSLPVLLDLDGSPRRPAVRGIGRWLRRGHDNGTLDRLGRASRSSNGTASAPGASPPGSPSSAPRALPRARLSLASHSTCPLTDSCPRPPSRASAAAKVCSWPRTIQSRAMSFPPRTGISSARLGIPPYSCLAPCFSRRLRVVSAASSPRPSPRDS